MIPSAFVPPQGTFEARGNDYIDPRYGKAATDSQAYWAGIGFFPNVQVSGCLANYPADTHVQIRRRGAFCLSSLDGERESPDTDFFKYQPSIAFGITDIGAKPITFVQSMAWYHGLSVRSHWLPATTRVIG